MSLFSSSNFKVAVAAAVATMAIFAPSAHAEVTQDAWAAGADQYSTYIPKLEDFVAQLAPPTSSVYAPSARMTRKEKRAYKAAVAAEQEQFRRKGQRQSEDLERLVTRATEDADTNLTNRNGAISAGYTDDTAVLANKLANAQYAQESGYMGKVNSVEDAYNAALDGATTVYSDAVIKASTDYQQAVYAAQTERQKDTKKCENKNNVAPKVPKKASKKAKDKAKKAAEKAKKARKTCIDKATAEYKDVVEDQGADLGAGTVRDRTLEAAEKTMEAAVKAAETRHDQDLAKLELDNGIAQVNLTYEFEAQQAALDRRQELATARSERQRVEEGRLIEDLQRDAQRLLEDFYGIED